MEKLRPSFPFTEERLRQLQQAVPEAFADGRINWEALREALGEHLEEETQEHFGLSWPGKREARRLAALPPQGALLPAPGEGVNEESTHHLFIEGENLEVLKLLQKSYAGRVKMIYIDPPYNTGNDFIYEDDYSEPLEAYLRRTGQADEAGRRLTTNTRASGRFHSRWLSMIYPRLLLARQLLREDGVIFVSIDDNEVHHLRMLMDEVFGEENFVGTFIWRKKEGGGQTDEFFVTEHEYIVVYRKSSEFSWVDETIETDDKKFNKITNDGKKYTIVKLAKWGSGAKRSDRPTMYFPLTSPDGKKVYPIAPDGSEGRWRVGKKRMDWLIENDLIYWERRGKDWIPYEIIYYDEEQVKVIKDRSILFDETSTAEGTNILTDLFGKKDIFDNPKPVALIRFFLRNNTNERDVVLDFFAGSGSSAHAVLQQNREDGGRRQFIMVQLPEPTPPDSEARRAGYATIAEIGKERIRRVIRRMQAERAGQQLPLAAGGEEGEDLGFRVFKLGRSHFRPWSEIPPVPAASFDDLLAQQASPLEEGWTREGLLGEILLIEGFPLDSQVTPLEAFAENQVVRVHHPDVGHELFVCLDEKLSDASVARLKGGSVLRAEDVFICLDSALSDEAKAVLDDRLRLKVI